MSSRNLLLGALLSGLALLLPAGVRSEQFVVRPGGKNLVRFDSKAPIESFSGKTREVSGTLLVNPASLADSVHVSAEVDLATLDTGIGIRDRHMREEHLETALFPKAVFTAGRLVDPSSPALSEGTKTGFTLEGLFTLHGVTKEIRVPVEAELIRRDGQTAIHAVARFDVRLEDYEISRPQLLVLRLGEVQHVTIDITAVAP